MHIDINIYTHTYTLVDFGDVSYGSIQEIPTVLFLLLQTLLGILFVIVGVV